MWLQMDLDGIIAKLQIQQYTKRDDLAGDECYYDYWCKVSFSFFSEPWLNYNKDDREVFRSCEVDNLAQALDDLINDRLTEPAEIGFIEPDFCFELSPKEDMREDPQVLFVKEGHEIIDIFMDWQVYFWADDGCLTANHLSVTLDREDIIHLRNYLYLIMGKYNESTPEIVEMKEKGILY